MPVLVTRLDHHKNTLQILYCDKNHGMSEEDILGKNLREIGLEQQNYEQCEASFNQVFITGAKEVFQMYSGNRHYHISYLPECSSEGIVATILAIVRDITEEQILKEELTISQIKLQMAQQIAMLGYFEGDIASDKLYWSDQFYKNFGLVPKEKTPSIELLLSLIHPEDVGRIRQGLVQIPTQELINYEYRIIKKDDSINWIHTLVQFAFDKDGKPLKKFGIIQDITRRKTLEMEFKKLTEELQQANNLLNASHSRIKIAGIIAKVGYFEMDIVNDSLYWSDQQYRNFGYTPQEFKPTIEFFHSRIHPGDLDIVKTGFAELSTQAEVEYQFRIIKADGTIGWLYSRINSNTDEQGQRTKIFGITQDITEQKKTLERITQVERDLIFTNQMYHRSTYLNKLLVNDCQEEDIIKTLNEFGIETTGEYCCFVVRLSEKLSFMPDILDCDVNTKNGAKQKVLIWLAEREEGLIWKFNDDIIMLMSMTGINGKYSQIAFVNQLIGEMEGVFPSIYVKIGISGVAGLPINLRGIYENAHRAALVASMIEGSSTAHCDDIGLYDVAIQLLNDKNTCAMIQKTIGRLAEYDQKRGSDLVLTLEYILTDMSLKTVGEKLFIHHNTVIWRKGRIEVLLGMSLDKIETRVLLLLYFKIWNLQKL